MSKVIQITNQQIRQKLELIRDKNIKSNDFRALVEEVSMFMACKIIHNIQLEEIELKTHVWTTTYKLLVAKKMVIIPILRTGLGMVDGILKTIPDAKVGHLGVYRNEETLKPVDNFCKLPKDIKERNVLITDLMITTGSSVMDAISILMETGVVNIKIMCILAAPEGIKAIQDKYPDIDIYVASIDENLKMTGYIIPGFCDDEDELFGTK